jgi:hypothetical protein
MFKTEVIQYKGDLYIVKRKFTDHPNFPIQEAKEHFYCDQVLRKEGKLYFCEKIQEAQIIEEYE